MDKLISVIVPIYQVEKYLDRCLLSIANQTYKNLEVILVNDGTKDNSVEICEKWVQKDSRFKLYSKVNGGLSDARNYGLKLATGDFIAFVDSDDFLDFDMYETLMDQINNNNSDIAICKYYTYEESNKSVTFDNNFSDSGKIENLSPIEAVKRLCSNEIESHVWDRIYSKDVLKGIEFPVRKNYEDIFVMHKIFLNAKKISIILTPKYYYVQRGDSICTTVSIKNIKDYLEGYFVRFQDLEDVVDLPTKLEIFKVIVSVFSYQSQFIAHKKDLNHEYELINQIDQKYSFKNCLPKKYKLKLLLFKFGISFKTQYKVFRSISKFKSLKNLYKKNKVRKNLLIKKSKYVFLGQPEYRNLGDQAIFNASINFINKYISKDVAVYTENEAYYCLNKIGKAIDKETVLFLQGGGNIGDVYLDQEGIRNKILKKFSKNKIVIFPSTIYFSDELKSNSILKKYRNDNILLICREKYSYDYLKQKGFTNVELSPDIVLSNTVINHDYKRKLVGVCLREDSESKLDFESRYKIKSLVSNTSKFMSFDTVVTDSQSDYNAVIKRALDEISHYQYVITDRLHAMVFCYITNTPCFVVQNYNKKIKGVYNWIEGGSVLLIDNLDELDSKIKELSFCKFNNKCLDERFDKLSSTIKKHLWGEING